MSELKWCLVWPDNPATTGRLFLVKNYGNSCLAILGKYLSLDYDSTILWMRERHLVHQSSRTSLRGTPGGYGSCWLYAAEDNKPLWGGLNLPRKFEFRWIVGHRDVTILDKEGKRILSEKRFHE